MTGKVPSPRIDDGSGGICASSTLCQVTKNVGRYVP